MLMMCIISVGQSAAGSFWQCTDSYEQQQQSFRQIHWTYVWH